jgi:hypothetical protein
MIASFPRWCAIVLLMGALGGCQLLPRAAAARRRAANEKAMAEARQRPLLMGRIALVNAETHFVLVDGADAQSPKAGASLRSYADGALSGELRATGVRRRPFFIADIVHGTPAKGDVVLQPGEGEAPTAPRAEPVRHQPPTPPAQPFPFWKRWLRGLRFGK